MVQQRSEVQVALVTGAGQGIGHAIALRLAQDGYDIAVADLRPDAVEQIAEEIRTRGRRALPLTVDITNEADRQSMFERTLEQLGRLDVLVNNAGVQRVADPLSVTDAHWDLVMNVNAKAVYFCCVEALKHMLASGSGRIVNIASAAGKTASTAYHPIYNVSKAAVLAMTKTFALTYANQGVRVNAICPGIIETPMQDVVDREFARVTGQHPEEIRAERLGRIPMGYAGEPQDVASVVSFLVGPDSRYMTGQAINVTGGMLTY
jgi:Dehydrogenases with different specificities (related to short-chain alcohol dehydrogenases)